MSSTDQFAGWPAGVEYKLVGASEAMRALFRSGRMLAASPGPVLIFGPGGSGKYRFARALHGIGPAAGERFISTREASHEALFGTELHFGQSGFHARCHFLDARRGTLYLADAERLDVRSQKLLVTALTSGFEYGIHRLEPGSVRVVLAAIREQAFLAAMAPELVALFRGRTVTLPGLDRRREDIPELVRYFVSVLSARQGLAAKPIEPAALQALSAREWPLNVRELEEVTERALTRSRGPTLKTTDFLARDSDTQVGILADGQVLSGYYADRPAASEDAPESRPRKRWRDPSA